MVFIFLSSILPNFDREKYGLHIVQNTYDNLTLQSSDTSLILTDLIGRMAHKIRNWQENIEYACNHPI